jgi:hypothetical protein
LQFGEFVVLFFLLPVLGGFVDEASLMVREVDVEDNRSSLAYAKSTSYEEVLSFHIGFLLVIVEQNEHRRCYSANREEDEPLGAWVNIIKLS